MGFDAGKYTKGQWLKGEDLEEGERMVVTIKRAEEHTFQSGEMQPVLEFLEIDQKLTLNKTRIRKLIEMLGDDTDTWVDQKISLYTVPVQFNGKTMMSIAIAPAPKKKAAAAPAPSRDVKFMDDDDAPGNPF